VTDSLFPDLVNYEAFLSALKTRVRTAQMQALLSVNRELVILYWQIGKDILQRQQEEGWGAKVIDRLAKDLKRDFPDMQGLSARNLKYMRSFAETYPDEQIVQEVLAQIPWYHNIALLEKLGSLQERLWYAKKTVANGWSRNILVMQIESRLYDWQGGAITNFANTLPALDSDFAKGLLKDPYNLDFLNLSEDAKERDMERGLVDHIRQFLMELGMGFAFLGNQYPIEVSGKEYRMDMLFYHVPLHRYVVIDLKMGEFLPEHSGQMSFYVAAVNNLLRTERDDSTIGIILCRSKDRTTVEYALQGNSQPIGVSSYQLQPGLPEELKKNLPTPEQLEMEFNTAIAELEGQKQEPES